jgi:glycosyltransferase involved in cell wall biosynthesis
LPMVGSMVADRDVVAAPADRDWAGVITLLTIGRLDPEKNPLLLIEALADLERRFPGRYRLKWAGRGEMETAVKRKAVERRIIDCIDFLGYVPFGPDLLSLYRNAHIFVHVSLTEGVPRVLVEALASGVPVIATDVGGVTTLLDGGRAGLLVRPSDATALSDGIVRMTREESLREDVTRYGLAVARSMTREQMVQRTAQFISGSLRWNSFQ